MLSYMAETLQQTQTLSLRISEALRKRLEDIRKLTALRKGESISTSEIAKQLLESAREDRFEVVELLNRPSEALLEIRRKGEAGQMLTRAQWTVVAYYVQQGSEAFSKNPLSRESYIGILKAFDAAHQLRAKASLCSVVCFCLRTSGTQLLASIFQSGTKTLCRLGRSTVPPANGPQTSLLSNVKIYGRSCDSTAFWVTRRSS
jgi:hypothetical protein